MKIWLYCLWVSFATPGFWICVVMAGISWYAREPFVSLVFIFFILCAVTIHAVAIIQSDKSPGA